MIRAPSGLMLLRLLYVMVWGTGNDCENEKHSLALVVHIYQIVTPKNK